MFSKILFPTDFSAYANAVLARPADLKAAGVGIVVLLSVIRSSDVPTPERSTAKAWNYGVSAWRNN